MHESRRSALALRASEQHEIGKYEAVPQNGLSRLYSKWPPEHRTGVRERVKLAALAAGIDRRGQFF